MFPRCLEMRDVMGGISTSTLTECSYDFGTLPRPERHRLLPRRGGILSEHFIAGLTFRWARAAVRHQDLSPRKKHE